VDPPFKIDPMHMNFNASRKIKKSIKTLRIVMFKQLQFVFQDIQSEHPVSHNKILQLPSSRAKVYFKRVTNELEK
jgi:hypothetical protein